MAKQKVFKVYSDSAHSWMAVKKKELAELGLTNQVSSSSYVHGASVYLEEDSDLTKFKTVYEAKYGPMQTVTVDHGARSWVRNYTPYVNPVTAETVNGFMKENLATDSATSDVLSDPTLAVEVGVTLNLPETAVNLKSDF